MLNYFTFFKSDVIAIYKHLLRLEYEIEKGDKQWTNKDVESYFNYIKKGYYNRRFFVKRLSKQRIDILVDTLNKKQKNAHKETEDLMEALANANINTSTREQTWDAFEDERLDKKTFTINVGKTDPEKAKESMAKLMNNYKEEINFDTEEDKTKE